jgi:phage baseplate assembly protein W
MSIAFQDRNLNLKPTKEFFSDFYTDLNAHPDTMQVMKYTNEKAVIRSIKNLLSTDKYERLFQPDIGSDITKQLFELITPITTATLKTAIETTIKRYEPRAGLLDVIVTPYEERNLYVITITFFIANSQEATTFTVQLSRVR